MPWKDTQSYRRQLGTDGKSPFEILFGNKPRFSFEAPHYGPIAANSEIIRWIEIALVKSLRASRVVPYTTSKWPNKFDVGDTVLLRRGRRKPGSKVLSPAWYGPFIVKADNPARYTLRTDDRRRFRSTVHARRLRPYVERQYGPEISMCCWFRNLGLHDVE